MKPLEIVFIALLLSGCSQSPRVVQAPEDADVITRREAVATEQNVPAATAEAPGVEVQADQGEQDYLPVADWLVQRRSACDQSWESIETQLNRHEQALKQEQPQTDHEVSHAYTQLKALMLATCNPARTPGVLRILLDQIGDYDWPPEHMALFDLLESEYSAYALLEDRYEDLQERHKKTIDGIGNIERSLDSDADAIN
ncbi:hypothetical protein F6455_17345 [Proteobacteria bacterium 005FR1]|nr:hypothetical protein [Proteobacteria bacterium 005FR1]